VERVDVLGGLIHEYRHVECVEELGIDPVPLEAYGNGHCS
jgi:hypothetical protein